MKEYPKYYISNDISFDRGLLYYKVNDNKGNVTHVYKNKIVFNGKWDKKILEKYIINNLLLEIPAAELALII